MRGLYHLEVNVGEKQFLIAAVHDGGVVGTGKHIGHTSRSERFQYQRLGSQDHSLRSTQVTWGGGGDDGKRKMR